MTRHTDAHGEWDGMGTAVGAAALFAGCVVLVCVVAVLSFVYVVVTAATGN